MAVSIPTAVRRVLAPTDLSDLGNGAIGWAYAIVAAGGIVRLLHVIEPRLLPNPLYAHYTPGQTPTPEERERQRTALAATLRALIPAEAETRAIATEIDVVEGDPVASAIVEAGDRFAAEVICLGSHGRSGVRALVAGSVAQRVIANAHRPLLLVPPPHP
jgi:nucleotide-binding universal stress UspA family protein